MSEERTAGELAADEGESTGLPWPASWRAAYLFVIASFVVWLVLLIALTEFFK